MSLKPSARKMVRIAGRSASSPTQVRPTFSGTALATIPKRIRLAPNPTFSSRLVSTGGKLADRGRTPKAGSPGAR